MFTRIAGIIAVVILAATAPAAEPTVYFTASPVVVTRGGQTTLSWTAENATACTAGGHWVGAKALRGVEVISGLATDKHFTITASNGSQSATFRVDVKVIDEPSVPFMEDADTGLAPSAPGSPTRDFKAPRIGAIEGAHLSITDSACTKYDAISIHFMQKSKLSRVLALRPDILALYNLAPEEFATVSMGFTQTGPATQFGFPDRAGTVYAGHWWYSIGSTLTQNLSGSTADDGVVVSVANASRFEVGQYVCIYDAPRGSFNNPEHCQVTARNTTANTVTLGDRGYKSSKSYHASGSIIVQHKQGWARPENWSYNMSTACPEDANGKQAWELIADWIDYNLLRNEYGQIVSGLRMDGVYYDADPYWAEPTSWYNGQQMDANNDGAADGGIVGGVNVWGQGMEAMYDRVRDHLGTARIQIGGDRYSRGVSLHGTQMESAPFNYTTSYQLNGSNPISSFDSCMQIYSFNLHHMRQGPAYSDIFFRSATANYSVDGDTGPDNRPFRFTFAMAMLDDGYFSPIDHQIPSGDPWWEEFAVDVTPGSANYGKAIAKSAPISTIRQHKGWLGDPLSPRRRIYDAADINGETNRVSNGGADSSTSGWTTSNVSMARETDPSHVFSGSGCARFTATNTSSETSAYGASPSVNLQAGHTYTVSFMIKSSVVREMQVLAPGAGVNQKIFVSPAWRRVVLTSIPSNNINGGRVWFYIGRVPSQVWVDDVHIVEGPPRLLRRDYENGAVILNATGSSRTVNLGGTFKRILRSGSPGTDDPNSGATVTSVTIPAYDAAILVRPYSAPPDTAARHWEMWQ